MEEANIQEQAKTGNENIAKPDGEKIRAALIEGALIDTPTVEKEGDVDNTGGTPPTSNTEKPATETAKENIKPSDKPIEGAVVKSDYEPIWNNLQKLYEGQFGENTFKKPEGITPETEFETLLDFIHKSLEPNLDGIPDEAREIIELHREGTYNPDEYFKQKGSQVSIESLAPYDLLFNMYRSEQGKSDKNPDGYTDDEIHEYLKGLNKIQIKELADQKKASITAYREQTKQQREQEQLRLSEAQFTNIQKQKEDQAKKIVNQLGTSVDFFGIEPSSEDRASYNRDFVEMVKLNPKTGTSKLYDALQDDALLYKIGYYIWKGENLRGYLTEMKENVKKNIESRLDPTLSTEKGSTKLSKTVDRGKLF